MKLYSLHFSFSYAESVLGASIYVIYVSEMFEEPCFVLYDLSTQSLLPLRSRFSFFHYILPLLPIQPFLPFTQFDLVLLSFPHALFQAFTWLRLLLCADDSQMHSPPRWFIAQPLFSSLPFPL